MDFEELEELEWGTFLTSAVNNEDAANAMESLLIEQSIKDNVKGEYLQQLYEHDENNTALDYGNNILSIFFSALEEFSQSGDYSMHAFYTPPQLKNKNSIIPITNYSTVHNCKLSFNSDYRDNGESDQLYHMLYETLLTTLNYIPKDYTYAPGLIKILFKENNTKENFIFYWSVYPMCIRGVKPDDKNLSGSTLHIEGFNIYSKYLEAFKKRSKFINSWLVSGTTEERNIILGNATQLVGIFFARSMVSEGHYRFSTIVNGDDEVYKGSMEWFSSRKDSSVIPLLDSRVGRDPFELAALAISGHFDNCSLILESNLNEEVRVNTWSVVDCNIRINDDDEASRMLWEQTDSSISPEDHKEIIFDSSMDIELE